MGSYGKDSEHANRIAANLSTRMNNASRPAPRTGGKAPHWANQYYPSEHVVDSIQLVPGNYNITRLDDNNAPYTTEEAWFECSMHYHGVLSKSIICSAGPYRGQKGKSDPCCGCEIYWADWAERKAIQDRTGQKVKSPNRVSKADKYVFHALDKGYWFKGPDLDEKGVAKTDREGKPYTRWIKYDHSPLHGHLLAQAKPEEQRWGRILDFAMGHDQFGLFTGYAEAIGKNCASCGGYQTLHVVKWSCQRCKSDLFDPRVLQVSPQQLKELTGKQTRCNACQFVGYADEGLMCTNCPHPRRSSLFDATFQMQSRKDPSTDKRAIIVHNYSTGPIEPHFQDLLQHLPNFAEKYSPIPYAEQAALFQQHGGGAPPSPAGAPVAAPGMVPNPTPGALFTPYANQAPVIPGAVPGMQAPVATPPTVAPQAAQPAAAANWGITPGWSNR